MTLLDSIKEAYDALAQFNISITGLIALSLLCSLAFLFAMREAAAWFFKVDDLRRDVRRLQGISLELETEIKNLQASLLKAKSAAEIIPAPNKSAPPTFPISH